MLAAIPLAAGCSGVEVEKSADHEVRIFVFNAGTKPLQCMVKFGHWVDRDLGIVTATGVAVTVQQQPEDGALYVLREDGLRRMMVENIFCAKEDDWQATVGQMDLAMVRRERPSEIRVSCALPLEGGRVTCDEPRLTYAK
ncbi:hypothetical protein DLREEDagr8_05070 [Dongia sp. agr-C8]